MSPALQRQPGPALVIVHHVRSSQLMRQNALDDADESLERISALALAAVLSQTSMSSLSLCLNKCGAAPARLNSLGGIQSIHYHYSWAQCFLQPLSSQGCHFKESKNARGSLTNRGHSHEPYLLKQPPTLNYVPHVLQMSSYVVASHEDCDPVNSLDNYVRGHPDGNLAPFLTWNIRRVDSSDETTYHVGVTYRFKGDRIGYGRGPSIDAAKKEAAIAALLCLKLTSIRDDFDVSTKTKDS
ncbi:hypothetical protein EDB89DRAFT_2064930 [Lactarius sanguifluus]|nr:hypothetical protein EDB89DRAFT_2064930 [Lactarius sanguifluus]